MSIVENFKISNRPYSHLGNGMHNLAEIFKREKVNGKSQKEAAEFLGIDHRSVSRHMKQQNIGLDILMKYAEYLECSVEDFVSHKVNRQICGYFQNNKVNFYGENEARPVIYGLFAASWWWSSKKTLLIIDHNNPKSVYYNVLNFYDEWQSVVRIADSVIGIYQDLETLEYKSGIITRKSEDTFFCKGFYDSEAQILKLKRFSRWICSYNLNDLPLFLE